MLEGPQPFWTPEFQYSSNIVGVYSTLPNVIRWRRVVQIADRQLPQLTLEAEILGDTATQSNNHDYPILFNPIYKSLYDTCNSEQFQQENILSAETRWNFVKICSKKTTWMNGKCHKHFDSTGNIFENIIHGTC